MPGPMSNGNGVIPRRNIPALSLADLHEKAKVNPSETTNYTPKQWLSVIGKLYDEGDRAWNIGDLNNAYYHYLKGCNVMVEILNLHPASNDVKKTSVYIELKKRTSDEILYNLEKIKMRLEQQQQQQQQPVDNGDDLVGRALEKFPAVSELELTITGGSSKHEVSLDDMLPSVPTHAPTKAGPPQRHMKMPEPTPTAPNTTMNSTPQPKPPPPPMHMPVPQPSQQHKLPPTSSSSSPSSSSSGLALPGRTNHNFPQIMAVEPRDLAKWIKVQKNPPSVLLLDVRPLSMFQEGCIRHPYICQIEPMVLRRGVTSEKIQASLVLSDDSHQEVFSRRNEFDLVVYYDQDSKQPATASEPLRNLRSAIYESEFNKSLPRVPMMLAGGFIAWQQTIGEHGVYRSIKPRSTPADKENENPKKERSHRHHWLHSVVGRSSARKEPVQVHYTAFDYFTNKQRDRPLQSMDQQHKPAVQGIFGNWLDSSAASSRPDNNALPLTMPIAPPDLRPSEETTPRTPTEESISAKYPDIRPNTSSAAAAANNNTGLQRRNTFIDNPFHGFTETKNDLYDVPPIPPKPRRPLPPPPPPPSRTPPTHTQEAKIVRPSSAGAIAAAPTPPAIPSKPSALVPIHHPVAESRFAPVSDSSFSQLGSVMIGTTGLKNLGNTCYMNSIVQCLSGTIPLARYLISGTYKRDLNKNNPLGTGGVLVQCFSDLLRVMWSGSYSFISPVTFREALGPFAPQFSGTDQQDSQEFLVFLLDGLHEDVNLVQRRPSPRPEDPEEEARFERLPDWQASAIAWDRYLERNKSIIVSLFQGQYRSRLTCLTCKQTSTTYNTFMSLSLPIPKGNSTVSLYHCLDAFVKEEILENDDAWHCPRCKTFRRSSKRLTLSRLPVVLLVHLKRFSFDGPFRNKLETLVNYPTRDLDLSPYVPSSMNPPDMKERPIHRYDLYGVSNHYGSLTGGHYTACVRNGYRQEWHYFDDTRFSVCDEGKAVSRAAYNLFYVRSTVK